MPDGSATARAINCLVNRWLAFFRYLDDDTLPIDSNWVQNCIRPVALGRSNWLFTGSLHAGQRAAAVMMSLIQSAKLNDHEPFRYPKDLLARLPTHPKEAHRGTAAASLDAGRCQQLIHHWTTQSGPREDDFAALAVERHAYSVELPRKQQHRLRDLECENRDLKRVNEIVRKASTLFARATLNRQPK